MTEINQEQIDNYHSGRMSESEMAGFHKKMEADPSFQAESNFQSDVVEGLKAYRKADLKSRLDAINVGPTWFEFAQQSALMKSMGGVIVASVIGTGIFFLGEKEEKNFESKPISIEAPIKESIDYVWDLGIDKSESQENVLENPIVTNDNQVKGNNSSIELASTETIPEESVVQKTEAFKPSFDAPSVESVEDNQFVASDLDELPENNANEATDDPIDVKTENSRNTSIKYKYYDGKLFLSGDFNKTPYEILEINSSSARRIYVYYIGKYYKVGVTDKLTDLPQVTNKDVIKELELLRANK